MIKLSCRYANHQNLTVSQQKLNELTNELVQLKKEVAELNKNLPRNVEDLKLNLDSIKKILNERFVWLPLYGNSMINFSLPIRDPFAYEIPLLTLTV